MKPTTHQLLNPNTIVTSYSDSRTNLQRLEDNVLKAFFNTIGLPMNEPGDVHFSKDNEDNILVKLAGFADYLIDNFFLPC